MNNRWIIVFDWETDSPDPTTCNPVELAAIPIDPRTLDIKVDKAFNATIKPPGITKEENFTDEKRDDNPYSQKPKNPLKVNKLY